MSIRDVGSYIGHNRATTTALDSASGIWSLAAVERRMRAAAWPTLVAPNAPTSLTATAGNAQLSLSWTAPSAPGTSAITGYVVEYTPSGGSASTVNTNSTSTSYTLTGLTNGTAYTVRVAAISAVGTGAYSATATGTPAPGAVTYTSGTSGGISGTGNTSSDKFQSISNSNQLTVTIQSSGSYRIQLEGKGRRIFKNGVAQDWSGGGIVFPEDGFYVFEAVSVSAGTTVAVDAGQRFHIWKE